MTLYEELRSASIEMDAHESDLYFVATDEARAILRKQPETIRRNARTFMAWGKPWIEVPFAYDPFWSRA